MSGFARPIAAMQEERVEYHKESRKGRMADALAHGGDEGRDKLR